MASVNDPVLDAYKETATLRRRILVALLIFFLVSVSFAPFEIGHVKDWLIASGKLRDWEAVSALESRLKRFNASGFCPDSTTLEYVSAALENGTLLVALPRTHTCRDAPSETVEASGRRDAVICRWQDFLDSAEYARKMLKSVLATLRDQHIVFVPCIPPQPDRSLTGRSNGQPREYDGTEPSDSGGSPPTEDLGSWRISDLEAVSDLILLSSNARPEDTGGRKPIEWERFPKSRSRIPVISSGRYRLYLTERQRSELRSTLDWLDGRPTEKEPSLNEMLRLLDLLEEGMRADSSTGAAAVAGPSTTSPNGTRNEEDRRGLAPDRPTIPFFGQDLPAAPLYILSPVILGILLIAIVRLTKHLDDLFESADSTTKAQIALLPTLLHPTGDSGRSRETGSVALVLLLAAVCAYEIFVLLTLTRYIFFAIERVAILYFVPAMSIAVWNIAAVERIARRTKLFGSVLGEGHR